MPTDTTKRPRPDDSDEAAAEREAARAAKKLALKSPASTFAFTDDRRSLLQFATELDEQHNISLDELVSVFSGLGRNVDGTTTASEIEALSAGRRWHAAMHASQHLKRLLPKLAQYMPRGQPSAAAASDAESTDSHENASGTTSQSDSGSASDELQSPKLTQRALERQNVHGMQQGKSTISFSIFCQSMLFAARDTVISTGDDERSD